MDTYRLSRGFLHRPWRWYGAPTAFCRDHNSSWSSFRLWSRGASTAFIALSRRSQLHIDALSRHSRGIKKIVERRVERSTIASNAVASRTENAAGAPHTTIAFVLRPQCAHTVVFARRCWRPYGAPMALLSRPGTAFDLCMLKTNAVPWPCVTFYSIPRNIYKVYLRRSPRWSAILERRGSAVRARP